MLSTSLVSLDAPKSLVPLETRFIEFVCISGFVISLIILKKVLIKLYRVTNSNYLGKRTSGNFWTIILVIAAFWYSSKAFARRFIFSASALALTSMAYAWDSPFSLVDSA